MPGRPLFLLLSAGENIGFAVRPEFFAERSPMDAFSEVLSAVKLKGALFFNAEFSAPWGIASPRSDTMVPALLPDAEHLVIFHLLIEGSAFVQLEDGQPIHLSAGE